MYAVGVDISDGWSTVAVLRSKTDIVIRPFNVTHNSQGFAHLLEKLGALDGEVRVVMEHTGNYYESIANVLHESGLWVSAVNPLLIRNYGDNSLHGVKTDKADAKKIARYALDNWEELRQYSPMDTIRYQLKTLNCQFQLANKNHTACSNDLIALMERSYPGVRSLFSSPVRPDGSQKWADFAQAFWHVDCVAKLNMNAFAVKYQRWSKRRSYSCSETKAVAIHENAKTLFPLVPKSDITKLLVREAITQLNTISHTA